MNDRRSLIVPIRPDPERPDSRDAERVDMVMRRWNAQNNAYLGFSKTVEENIRMLSGRQWDRWSNLYGRFVDVLQYMSEDERRYRQRPVMDYLGYWYVLTLSKLVENRAVIGFQPATSDRVDALLAEVMDPIWKTLWYDMQMDERRMKMAGWLLVAGEGYYVTRADFSQGPKRQLIAPAQLSLDRPGLEPIVRDVEAVPYDQKGRPLAKLRPDPDADGEYSYDVTGDPYEDLEGVPRVDVYCPLQVRAQWGQQIAWRDKTWIATETFLTPDQVKLQTGVDCDPDAYMGDDDAGSPGYLERMMFGSGYFGSVSDQGNGAASSSSQEAKNAEGFVRVVTMWEKPIKGISDPTEELRAGGRMILVAPGQKKVLWDSMRPFKTVCAGPIRRATYLDIPGRPTGSTPLEKMVPLQRRLNRIEAHIAQHTNLCSDPIMLVHESVEIDEDEFVARPGLVLTHGFNGTGQPVYYVAPPALSNDVWKHKADVKEQLFVIGSIIGNQSQAPTADASGELVEQLRVNADRPLTPATQSMAQAEADVAEDVLAILPTIYTEEKLIAVAGEDNVVRTVKVLPDMLEAQINVRPNLESAAAESKDKRRARLIQLYQLGAFGNVTDPSTQPKAVKMLLELINFPDLTRAARPGGVDRIMGEHMVGRLIRGDQAAEIPLLKVYDYDVLIDVVQNEMKAPEYVENTDVLIQEQFVTFLEMLEQAREVKTIDGIASGLPTAQAMTAAQAAVSSAGRAAAGPPPAEAGGNSGAGSGAPPAENAA
jgi:hypothetical protein